MSRSRPLPQMVVRPLDSGRGRAFRIVLGLAWIATVALAWYLGGRQAAPAYGLTRDALAQVQASSAHLDQELESFAQQENQQVAQVKAKLKKDGSLERLRDDLFRRRVLDRLVEKAQVTVAAVGHHPGEE